MEEKKIARISHFSGSVSSPDNQKLTKWFRVQRHQQHLTMRELGERLNVPHSYISKIEYCERRLDIVEFTRYCKALDVDPHEALNVIVEK